MQFTDGVLHGFRPNSRSPLGYGRPFGHYSVILCRGWCSPCLHLNQGIPPFQPTSPLCNVQAAWGWGGGGRGKTSLVYCAFRPGSGMQPSTRAPHVCHFAPVMAPSMDPHARGAALKVIPSTHRCDVGLEHRCDVGLEGVGTPHQCLLEPPRRSAVRWGDAAGLRQGRVFGRCLPGENPPLI